MRGGGFYLKKTLLTLGYIAACVVIKRLCLSAGVRWVTRWRWDDAVRSHTLVSQTVKEGNRKTVKQAQCGAALQPRPS